MIGDLIAASINHENDITIIVASDRERLVTYPSSRCTLLSFSSVWCDNVEIWQATNPGISKAAWDTLCTVAA